MKPVLLVTVSLALGSAMGASWPKVGPKFEPPKASVPNSYRQQAGAAGTNTDAAVGNWWTTLNDPEDTIYQGTPLGWAMHGGQTEVERYLRGQNTDQPRL